MFVLWMGISHGWFLKLLSCCCKMVMSAAKSRHHEEGALTLGSLESDGTTSSRKDVEALGLSLCVPAGLALLPSKSQVRTQACIPVSSDSVQYGIAGPCSHTMYLYRELALYCMHAKRTQQTNGKFVHGAV